MTGHVISCEGHYDRGHNSGLIRKQISFATNVRLYYTQLKSTTGLFFNRIQTHFWPFLMWGRVSYFNPQNATHLRMLLSCLLQRLCLRISRRHMLPILEVSSQHGSISQVLRIQIPFSFPDLWTSPPGVRPVSLIVIDSQLEAVHQVTSGHMTSHHILPLFLSSFLPSPPLP